MTLIDPTAFPFQSESMDVQGLERAADELRRLGSGVSDGADALVLTWDGLQGSYEAPEQERVYGLMSPVAASAERLEGDLSTAAGHLDVYAETLGALRVRLMDLEERAAAFRAGVSAGVRVPAGEAADPGLVATGFVMVPWDQDTDTVIRNNALVLEHAKLVQDITTASSECHNALMDLVPGADEDDDLAPVDVSLLMDRRQEFPWGVPAAEDRNWVESIEHGVYQFEFNLISGLAGLFAGYNTTTGEQSAAYAGQSWLGLGNSLMSLSVAGASSMVDTRMPGFVGWLRGALPENAQDFLADRDEVAVTAGADLVGIDMQEHLAGGDGFWRWREDGIATGTESFLNIGTMFMPGGGAAGTAFRTGSAASRVLRIMTGAADFVVPGTSLLVGSTIRGTSGLVTAIRRLDDPSYVPGRPDATDGTPQPGVTVLDDSHIELDEPVGDDLFGEGAAESDPDVADDVDIVDGGGAADVPTLDPTPDTPLVDTTDYSTRLSQRQGRHVSGSPDYRPQSSYFLDASEPQRVLDAFHSGDFELLGFKPNGDVVIRVRDATGYNMNERLGYINQPTNVFFIKGTVRPSVVPYNPTWTP